jgi:hypothetical protein
MIEGKTPLYVGCVEPDDFPAGLVANLEKTYFPVASGMPRGWWRGPVHTFHAFAVQCFIDEIASRRNRTPFNCAWTCSDRRAA